jgi:hypothetical protein
MSFNAVEFLHGLVNEREALEGQISSPYDLPMEWRIEYEERAAILEYDGGLSREQADKQALSEILERIAKGGQR